MICPPKGLTVNRKIECPILTNQSNDCNIRYQYSIYAGRHVVPGLEGLLLECTADVIRMWSPLSVPRWSLIDKQVSCQHDKSLILLK